MNSFQRQNLVMELHKTFIRIAKNKKNCKLFSEKLKKA